MAGQHPWLTHARTCRLIGTHPHPPRAPQTGRRGDSRVIGAASFGATSPSRSWTFGSATQRPDHVCIEHTITSPGPAYHPSSTVTSTSARPSTLRFDKQPRVAGTDPTAGHASNSPLFNPAPGAYDPATTRLGGPLAPGQAALAWTFPRGRKMLSPQTDAAALPVISRLHAREFLGAGSPGPGRYSPDVSPTRPAAAAFTAPARGPSYFDAFFDPTRQTSPGPVCAPGGVDRHGSHSLGDGARATIGRAPKSYDPIANGLAATPFLSNEHARANCGAGVPGPQQYRPHALRTGLDATPTPVLGSGPVERFYTRQEPGRLQ